MTDGLPDLLGKNFIAGEETTAGKVIPKGQAAQP